MRTLRWLVASTVMVGACTVTPASFSTPTVMSSPSIDCRMSSGDCERALLSATALLERDSFGTPTRLVVLGGRARSFHAEVHSCFADGGYVLIDAIGPIAAAGTLDPVNSDVLKEATVRADPWDDPPCH